MRQPTATFYRMTIRSKNRKKKQQPLTSLVYVSHAYVKGLSDVVLLTPHAAPGGSATATKACFGAILPFNAD